MKSFDLYPARLALCFEDAYGIEWNISYYEANADHDTFLSSYVLKKIEWCRFHEVKMSILKKLFRDKNEAIKFFEESALLRFNEKGEVININASGIVIGIGKPKVI